MKVGMPEKEVIRHFRREFNKTKAVRKYDVLFMILICVALGSVLTVSACYGIWQAFLSVIPFALLLHVLIKKDEAAASRYAKSKIKE